MIDQFKLIYYYYYEFYYYYRCPQCALGCARVCMDVHGCVRVCVGMQGCAWVCTGVRSVGGCAQAFVKVCGCLRVCAWDEFSEYLLENRVPTSADFNTFPIQILVITYSQE